jgi:hypothetical protein
MQGQWIGKFTGDSEGSIVVNVDELRRTFRGVAYVTDADPTRPHAVAGFETNDKAGAQKFRAFLAPVNPRTGVADAWDNIKQFYPAGTVFSATADVSLSWDETSLLLNWETNLGAKGVAKLPRSRASEPSDLVPTEATWAEFKEYVLRLEGRRYIFRGQIERWRLRTSFHRSGRANLSRFRFEDLQTLHKHLSALTKHVFDLDVPNQNGAFLSLVQHHGYPTPLLDWTYSPYVAAFFAFRGVTKTAADSAPADARVRIHVFDQAEWKTDWTQIVMLDPATPHLSIGEFLAIENERMIPQQAAITVTNIDDIETYIREKESERRKTYLWAIDLPVRDREHVISELRYMGITAGALFPGLDGACEELRERYFDL